MKKLIACLFVLALSACGTVRTLAVDEPGATITRGTVISFDVVTPKKEQLTEAASTGTLTLGSGPASLIASGLIMAVNYQAEKPFRALVFLPEGTKENRMIRYPVNTNMVAVAEDRITVVEKGRGGTVYNHSEIERRNALNKAPDKK